MTRNLQQFPVTTDEIVNELDKLAKQHLANHPLGEFSLTTYILNLAANRIRELDKIKSGITTYSVIRTDDNGNTFTIKSNLTQDEATQLAKQMTLKGHKQTYEVKPEAND